MTDMCVSGPTDQNDAPVKESETLMLTTPRRPRTSEDFYLFCKFILEYENYNVEVVQEEHLGMRPLQPLDLYQEETTGEQSEMDTDPPAVSSSTSDDTGLGSSIGEEEDSYDLVTCFCKRPFAGRPMIECSKCLTWIHLSCAKVKRTKIPEVFICAKCKRRKNVKCKSNKSHSNGQLARHK